MKGVQDRAAEFQELIEGEEAEECRRETEVVATVSSKLLPSLFKLVDSLHSSEKSGKQNMQIEEDQVDDSSDNKIGETFSQVQALTQAIASLARVAPQALLQTLFKKVIQRLLEASQQEVDMSDKICSLLSLSQALVISQSLDETSVSLLYRSLKPLIRTDEARPRVQKRAYKAMAEICKRYHSFAIEGDRLKELCELLTSSIITSQISARHMRLKCLNNIVDGFDSSNKAHMVRRVYSACWTSECWTFETDVCFAFFILKGNDLKTRWRGSSMLKRFKCQDPRSSLPTAPVDGKDSKRYPWLLQACSSCTRSRDDPDEVSSSYGNVETSF